MSGFDERSRELALLMGFLSRRSEVYLVAFRSAIERACRERGEYVEEWDWLLGLIPKNSAPQLRVIRFPGDVA